MVRGAVASTLLSLLLTLTMLWGGCISCEQYFMLGGGKGCCNPGGHCKTKAPVKHSSDRECKQIAYDHEKAIHFHADLQIVRLVRPVELLTSTDIPFSHEDDAVLVDSSPPDLQVLHSAFLI